MKKIKKRYIAALILSVFIGISAFCYRYTNTSINKAKEIISKMSIDEKIGQMLMLDFRQWESNDTDKEYINVTSINDNIKTIIGDYHLGGVVLFAENCSNVEQLIKLTNDMQQASISKGGLPLLIATDQEGGNVTRAKFSTAFSGNMALGISNNTDNTYKAGKIIGEELNSLGINCDFAPVIDVNSNEKNPVIGVRSFSNETDVVSKMGIAMADGFKSSGIVNCAKHYPGHGDTSTDSHIGIPVVNKSYEEWMKTDGAPFEAIIKNGSTDLIMTAHVQYPELDDSKVYSEILKEDVIVPATMSKTILTDILKEKLGFEGVIITDAMDMDAIDEYFDKSDATIKAIIAGVDIVLMPVTIRNHEDIKELDELFGDIKDAINNGQISEDRINDALTRILKVKIESGILEKNYDTNLEEMTNNAINIVGNKEHREIEKEIAFDCLKMDYEGTFEPFVPTSFDKIVCVMPRKGEMYSSEHAINALKNEGVISNDILTEFYNYEDAWSNNKKLDEKMLEAISDADYLILSYFQTTDSLDNPEYIRNVVFDELLKYVNTKNVVILWEYLPYGTEKYNKDYPCLLLYNSVGMLQEDIGKETYSGVYGPAIPAGIKTIFGIKD